MSYKISSPLHDEIDSLRIALQKARANNSALREMLVAASYQVELLRASTVLAERLLQCHTVSKESESQTQAFSLPKSLTSLRGMHGSFSTPR